MSRRSILNMTSRKKRDTMQNYTNILATSQAGGTQYNTSPSVINGSVPVPYPVVWVATGRQMDLSSTGGRGNTTDEATRTSTSTYMRGLSEKIEIQVVDGLPWQWRRICFTYKGINNLLPSTTGFRTATLSSVGVVRTSNMVPNDTYLGTLEGLIFRGKKFNDWSDAMTAPLDTSRITVKYDKTRTIASNNEDGCIRKFSLWHPMNKSLVYDDDENGGDEDVQYFSVQSKIGMGDYIVVDYFRPRSGATTTNQISFNPTASLYWHEK